VLEQQKAFSGIFWRILALSVWLKRFNVEF